MLQTPVTLDLAFDRSRQVVVDREAGQYLGHVSTVMLEDGRTILCVYPKGHGKGAIILKRSYDGGRTWSARLPVPENWSTSQETPTIHRFVDPLTGKRRLIVWSGLYPVRKATSDDDGKTWTPLQKVGDWGGIVAMGACEPMRDGKLSAFFHDDGRFFANSGKATGTFTLYQTNSTDGGRTWSLPNPLWSGSDVHLCEPGAIRSPDGKTLALILRENRRIKNSHVIFSRDEAKTWTVPREANRAVTGDRQIARYAPDGRLVMVFRDMAKDSPTKGDFVGWVGTFSDLVLGRPGQYRFRLLDNVDSWDCGYPGLEVLPDGTFVATTYGHWDKGAPPYIVSVRFRLAELDAFAASRRR